MFSRIVFSSAPRQSSPWTHSRSCPWNHQSNRLVGVKVYRDISWLRTMHSCSDIRAVLLLSRLPVTHSGTVDRAIMFGRQKRRPSGQPGSAGTETRRIGACRTMSAKRGRALPLAMVVVFNKEIHGHVFALSHMMQYSMIQYYTVCVYHHPYTMHVHTFRPTTINIYRCYH